MKNFICAVLMAFCLFCLAKVVPAEEAVDISLMPTIGFSGVTSGHAYSMGSYGLQMEALDKSGWLSGGIEIQGLTGSRENHSDFDAYTGMYLNGFARTYFGYDREHYWLRPFVGVGAGWLTTNHDLPNDKTNMFAWNVDAGIKAELYEFENKTTLDGILAFRYMRAGDFSYDDYQTVGGYTGLGFTF